MKHLRALCLFFALLLLLSSCAFSATQGETPPASKPDASVSGQQTPGDGDTGGFRYEDLPEYDGEPFAVVCGGKPDFSEELYTTTSFETYAPLDELGRCGVAFAAIGRDLMPTEERGSIGQVKPSGWQTAKYDHVDGKYLYNRCHLIGFQLSGENANERNLITGTRYFNVEGMLPFENLVADYVKETGNHVLYRVTPVFVGDELVARGVLMEACSVEDEGDGVEFCVFCYNVQPRVEINYLTGYSTEKAADAESDTSPGDEAHYVLNTNTKKFHKETCSSASDIHPTNRKEITCHRDDLLADGYVPCGNCKP